jgi:excisionase family DNA binding protein
MVFFPQIKIAFERNPLQPGNIMHNLLTVREVADRLKLGYRTVLDLINYGKLEAYLIGNKYRISESAYLRYLDSTKVNINDRVSSVF